MKDRGLKFLEKGWIDCFNLDLKNAFDMLPRKRLTALETRKCRRIEGWFAEIDGRLFEQQRNENNNKRSEVRMVQCEKWSFSRISIGPSDVLGLYK